MKPPFKVPLMSEIRAIAWNGFKVVSTFSGCGGSCLGYRMAGFKVIWANEFLPAAQASYKANAESDCILDPRDIRDIQPEEILKTTGLRQCELDVFDGSPPCQAFSTAGKRERGWGQERTYGNGVKQCNELLFTEYLRLLKGLQPKVFVAENVSGLIKGAAKGMFLEILKEMKASGYMVSCRVLDAQWLGVPQCRQRTIFIGVRDDLNLQPIHPKPLSYNYSVRDALPWLQQAMVRGGYDEATPQTAVIDTPAPTIGAGGGPAYNPHYVQSLPSSRGIGGYGVQEVDVKKPCPTITIASPGNDLAVTIIHPSGFQAGQTDSIEDPSPCIMANGMGGMGQGQSLLQQGTVRRKFTIEELKRICAFPDDFILKGAYAQQWERLGNSVPPVMMFHIASVIRDEILEKVVQQ